MKRALLAAFLLSGAAFAQEEKAAEPTKPAAEAAKPAEPAAPPTEAAKPAEPAAPPTEAAKPAEPAASPTAGEAVKEEAKPGEPAKEEAKPGEPAKTEKTVAGEEKSGGPGFPGVEERETEQHEGIVNWWSLDYGPKAKDPAHKDWPPPFGFAVLNFLVFLGIMWKLLGKPLQQMARDRHDNIKKDLDEAKKLREGAAAMLSEYQKKVANVDAEIEDLLKSIRAEAETEKARIIAAAEEQAKRLKADAERQIAAEIERAKLELRRGVIEAAIASAEQLLQKQIGADDQRKMAESYVAGVEKKAS